MEYECPACGGSLTFDSKSQKIKCPFCDSEYEISQFEENDGMNWEVRPEANGMKGKKAAWKFTAAIRVEEKLSVKIRLYQQAVLTAAIL